MKRYKKIAGFVVLVSLVTGFSSCQKPRTVAADCSVKADSIISRMTLDEKIGQLNMETGNFMATGPVLKNSNKVKELEAGRIGSMLNVTGSADTRFLQQAALHSRMKIPLMFGEDVIHGYKTIFPIPLAQAASFDTLAIGSAACVAARESAVSGIQWIFSPMLDVARDPRWGRVMEGPGEDPFTAEQIAKAMIHGYQTPFADGLSVMACAKHFAAYSGVTGGRDYNTVDVSTQTLNNLYLPPFKAAAHEGIGSFMTAFNEVNGVPATANHYLLNTLYNDWKFKGITVSDWGSIGEMVVHGYSKDRKMAAYQAINAGVDIDMESYCYVDFLKQLVKEGKVSTRTIDDAVKKILIKKMELGLFDHPFKYCDSLREQKEVCSPANEQIARDVARKSIVLLKNSAHLLPLTSSPKHIAVIGTLADSKIDMDGAWVMLTNAHNGVTLLEALKAKYPKAVIDFVKGCEAGGKNQTEQQRAVAAARKADLVFLALGETYDMSGEAKSRGDLHLPGCQEDLACQIYQANPKTITLLMGGRPQIFNRIAEKAPAILYTWWLGSQAGNAMLDVITGDYNPSARLPMTFPKEMGQIPLFYNHKNSGRPPKDEKGNYCGRYIDIDYKPAYPFAYGLSYTRFEYSDFKLNKGAEDVRVSFTLKNVGNCDGRELVQAYVHKLWGESTRPVKELKAFRQVFLKKGESRKVELRIPFAELAYYGQDGWRRGKGDYELSVGRNAQDMIYQNTFGY